MSNSAWWSLRASEINSLPRPSTVVIVPVASTEQHGPHLPVQVDCTLVGEIAGRAAGRANVPVVVTPVVWTGLAEHHMSLGGTISLDFEAFAAMVGGICRSLVRQDLKRILLLNGHGGNIAALTVLVNELAPRLEAPIATATYWQLARSSFAEILEDQKSVWHACEAETSMMMALRPELVDRALLASAVGPTSQEIADIIGSDGAHRWQSFRARTSHGAIGDPRRASPEKGLALLEAASTAVATLVSNELFWAAQS